MRTVVAAVALFIAAASNGCHRDKCVPTCVKRAKELGCTSGDKCKEQCQALHTSPKCLAEMKAFEVCFLDEPTAHWICDEEGIPALSPLNCQPERGHIIDCLNHPAAPVAPAPAKK